VSLQLATSGDASRSPRATETRAPPRRSSPRAETTIAERVEQHLAAATAPLTAAALRKLCQIRNVTPQMALAALVADGRIRKDRAGYVIAS
jgi:predicted RNase H-like nuclease